MVERDRSVLRMLDTLPSLSPRQDFANRVMAQISRPVPATVPARRRPLALAASLAVALGASVIWSLFNRAVLSALVDRGGALVRGLIWEGFATLAQNLSEQPWIASLRAFGGSGARIVFAALVVAVGYAMAMVAFRRLMMSPAQAANPKW